MIYFVGSPKIPTDNSYLPTSFEHFYNHFQNKKVIGLDTETTGFDPHTCNLICVQFGDFEDQFVVEITEPKIVDNLRYLLEDSSRTFLLQNAKFDLRFFMKHDIRIPHVYDTFLAELILQTGIERSDQRVALDDIVWKYCNVKLDKTIRGNINKEGLTSRVIKYAADDVKYLHAVREKQLEQIVDLNLSSVLDLENTVTKVFAKMEYDGILIDQVKWLEVAKMTDIGKKTLEQELDVIVQKEPKLQRFVPKAIQGNLFGFEERNMALNWGSSQQKLDILKALDIDATSTGDRILQRNKQVHPLIGKLIAYNKQKKLNDAFGKDFLDHVNSITNRIHMDIWPVVSTGRIAVSAPNLNQIPSKGELAKIMRSCFIPKPGYKIVGGDYSGFELVIIAEYSQDPVWITALREGKDLHSELTALTFGVDITEVKKPFPPKPDITYRDVQKKIDFG